MRDKGSLMELSGLKARGVFTVELSDAETGALKQKEVVDNVVTDVFRLLPVVFAMQKWYGTYNPALQMAVNGVSETYAINLSAPTDYSLTSTLGLLHSIFLTDDNTPARADETKVRGNITGFVTGNTVTADTKQGNYLKNNLNFMDHHHMQRKFIFPAADGNGRFQKIFLGGYYPNPTDLQVGWLKSNFLHTLPSLFKSQG